MFLAIIESAAKSFQEGRRRGNPEIKVEGIYEVTYLLDTTTLSSSASCISSRMRNMTAVMVCQHSSFLPCLKNYLLNLQASCCEGPRNLTGLSPTSCPSPASDKVPDRFFVFNVTQGPCLASRFSTMVSNCFSIAAMTNEAPLRGTRTSTGTWTVSPN